jgi:hypothetical protein
MAWSAIETVMLKPLCHAAVFGVGFLNMLSDLGNHQDILIRFQPAPAKS